MKLNAGNFLNRSKSLYDDTTNTMRLSTIKSKLQTVSSSITNVNPFNKASVVDAVDPSSDTKEGTKKNRRKKNMERSNEPGSSRKSKRKEHKTRGSTKSNPPVEVQKRTPKAITRTTMDYVVAVDDTLSSVAARFNMTPSELCQLNRLVCRSLFAGQVIKVPEENKQPLDENCADDLHTVDSQFPEATGSSKVDIAFADEDKDDRGDEERDQTDQSHSSENDTSYSSFLEEEELTEDETDPMAARYLKMQAELVVDLKTLIPGQLLITTNSFLFTPALDHVSDPNLHHILLRLARIRSVAVYKDHSVLFFTKRDSHLPEPHSHAPRRAHSMSHNPLSSHNVGELQPKTDEETFVCAKRVCPTEAASIKDSMDNPLSPIVADTGSHSKQPLFQTDDFVPKNPQSSDTVVIPSNSDPTEYLCVLASSENAVRKRHPVWFTLQSEEYWFRIPVEKGPVLFQFLQACEFDEESVDEQVIPTPLSRLPPPSMHECMTSPVDLCEAATSSTPGGFVLVPNTYDWLLPRIGRIDECSKAMLKMKRKRHRRRVQSCKGSVSSARATEQSIDSSTHSVRSLGGDTKTTVRTSKELDLPPALSTPTLAEEKDALHFLKQESVRWEWIRTPFQHAWEHLVHWLVNSSELKHQEEEEKRRRFILDSLKMAVPERLPLPRSTNSSQILDQAKVRDIMQNLLPEAEGLDWYLTYSTSLHGFSLRTLYHRCSLEPGNEDTVQTSWTSCQTAPDLNSSYSSIHPCFMVLSTSNGEIFGAMLNTHPYPSGGRFYGNGSCYVFRWNKPDEKGTQSTSADCARKNPSAGIDVETETSAEHIPDEEIMKLVHHGHEVEPHSSAESTESMEQGIDVSVEFSRLFLLEDSQADGFEHVASPKISFEKFTWSGKNNFFISGDHDALTIGCAQGHSAIHVDDVLLHGRTEACETFDSPPLCTTEDFIIHNLEIWSFV